MSNFSSLVRRGMSLMGLSLLLSACTVGDRLANIGKAPDLAPIENVEAPTKQPSISLARPMRPVTANQPNSLWRTGAKAFFRDQRAGEIGDILTVLIEINDRAAIENQTVRTRNNGETAGLDGFLGFEGRLDKVLPNTVNPAAIADFGSTSSHSGAGEVDRAEDIQLTVAAIVTNVLPNGNLVIQGRQEVRVNFEVRELLIAGIVRPEDISSINTISHRQIAEARISYGGRGQITDVQQPRYGQQLYDILFPF